MAVKIETDRVVRITYRILDSDGRLMEERTPDHAYEYLHGRGQIVGPVERALEGKTPGFTSEILVTPRDGYGEYDPGLVAELPLAKFPAGIEVFVGMKFSTKSADGATVTVRVIEVDESTVTVDGNHPLAGLELVFDVKVLDVREALPTEVEGGKPHAETPNVVIRARKGGGVH